MALAALIFPRFSFDLIWGWPGHEVAAWRRQLGEALAMAGEHLSAYQLTIEPGTAFWREGVPAAGEDTGVALYEITREVLAGAGLPAYEISNHARPAGECRHNLAVWRGVDYLGIGPGAHGRLSRDGGTDATRAIRAPEKWLAKVEARGDGPRRARSARALGAARGAAAARSAPHAKASSATASGRSPASSRRTPSIGWPSRASSTAASSRSDAAGLRATPAGRLRLNAVLAQLLA